MITESFERIHRSNLVGMGIIPLEYLPGQNAESLGLTGKESYTIEIPDDMKTGQILNVEVMLSYCRWLLELMELFCRSNCDSFTHPERFINPTLVTGDNDLVFGRAHFSEVKSRVWQTEMH